MKVSTEQLDGAVKLGATKVEEAFNVLSGLTVKATNTKAEVLPIGRILEMVDPKDESIVVYSDLISDEIGVTLLTIRRRHALILVDLLTKQAVGTTGILMDVDRSAIKETLNILANSLVNALAETLGGKIDVGVPKMITQDSLKEVIDSRASKTSGTVIFFELGMEISEYKIDTSLFLLYNDPIM